MPEMVYALVKTSDLEKVFYVMPKLYVPGSMELEKAKQAYEELKIKALENNYEIIDKTRDVILPIKVDKKSLVIKKAIN